MTGLATATPTAPGGDALEDWRYTGIEFSGMATAPKNADQAKRQAYYQERIETLSQGLLDTVVDLFGKKSIQERQEFEDLVESRLQNGAKFIPRKRQPG